ncbi:MAG: tRNA 4-thiouridine(8) synthase ThiI [Candidatus Pacebacteria bacterium]|nr:tRNA 4-thiouridine(8) synthase ThiI [Candidatus Paceibacterota bacterium]
MRKSVKALVLMSGGLDSMLAAKVLEKQGVAVTPLCFESWFFSCTGARKAAVAIGMELRVENFSDAHLAVVKNPCHGRGGAANPCIDCHLLMLQTAKKIMEAEGYDIIATGEVVGQRSMSQNRQSLDVIEREAGLAGILLRPLSARLLPETEAEKKGLADRSRLCGISGRSRDQQLALAKELGIAYIPQPGGGCILTEADYGQKLAQLAQICPNYEGLDAQILRFGRPFWEGSALFVVARNQEECQSLSDRVKTGDLLFEPVNFSGPAVLARKFGGKIAKAEIESSGRKYLFQYSKKTPANPEISVKIIGQIEKSGQKG